MKQNKLKEFQPFNMKTVICGSYRKNFNLLKKEFEELKTIGFKILSPSNLQYKKERGGFVFFEGEEEKDPNLIEEEHLKLIQSCQFIWLHCPNGYVGKSGALEIGFAKANGIPIFCKEEPSELIIKNFVHLVKDPKDIIKQLIISPVRVPSALKTFQNYYKRIANFRGFKKETAKDCLLLMLEEIGEFARSIRKKENLERHQGYENYKSEAWELADIFLYVVHMFNILNLDLKDAIEEKEIFNFNKFKSRTK